VAEDQGLEERRSRIVRSRPYLLVCLAVIAVGIVYLFLRGGWIGPSLIALGLVAGFGGLAFPYLKDFIFGIRGGGTAATFEGKLTDPATAVTETTDLPEAPPPEPPPRGLGRLRARFGRHSRSKGSAEG
jgi:hypothetical protein